MSLIYEIGLPIVGIPAVTKRVLKIEVDGVETLRTLEPSDTVNRLYPVLEGSLVSVSLQDIDNLGNENAVGDTLSFTANGDSILSPPGQVSARLLYKVDQAVVVPPAPPVVEEVVSPEPEPEPEPPVEDTVPAASHSE